MNLLGAVFIAARSTAASSNDGAGGGEATGKGETFN